MSKEFIKLKNEAIVKVLLSAHNMADVIAQQSWDLVEYKCKCVDARMEYLETVKAYKAIKPIQEPDNKESFEAQEPFDGILY